MKTVEVLAATLALFSDKTNWVHGKLITNRVVGTDENDEPIVKPCFCAEGGIAMSGGMFEPDGRKGMLAVKPKSCVLVSSTSGFYEASENGVTVSKYSLPRTPRAILKRLEDKGIHVVATIKARDYLQQAINDVVAKKHPGAGKYEIYVANDDLGYEFIMEALQLAVKRAKRRHINGDRKKNTSVQAVAQ